MSSSFTSTFFYAGSGFTARCAIYPDRVPVLILDAPAITVSLTPEAREATGEAVEFARMLARAAREFAAEVERMHAARLTDASGTADGSAADGKAA